MQNTQPLTFSDQRFPIPDIVGGVFDAGNAIASQGDVIRCYLIVNANFLPIK